jgi:hypothetical protein
MHFSTFSSLQFAWRAMDRFPLLIPPASFVAAAAHDP